MTNTLTQRECQVADLMMQGLSYTQIADELEISPNTVKTHRMLLYSKLGINSKRELFALNRPAPVTKTEQSPYVLIRAICGYETKV